MTTCPRCGAPIPMAAKFCANCGAPSELGQAANAAFDAVLDSARAKTRLPENTRAVDLEAETIRAFRAEMLEPLKRAGRELSVNVIDLEVGNVGGHAGQFVTATVLAPSDPAGIPAALALILSNFAGDPDIVSVRVEFKDERGRRVGRTVTDTTDCTLAISGDATVMYQFARTHTRME